MNLYGSYQKVNRGRNRYHGIAKFDPWDEYDYSDYNDTDV